MAFDGDYKAVFKSATEDMLRAAKALMPFPLKYNNERADEYAKKMSRDECENYLLYTEIEKKIKQGRTVPEDALKKNAALLAGDHFKRNQKLYVQYNWDNAVTKVFVEAAARQDIAYDIAGMLASDDININDEKQADLSRKFLAIASHCTVTHLTGIAQGNPHLYLQGAQFIAMGLKRDIKPIAA